MADNTKRTHPRIYYLHHRLAGAVGDIAARFDHCKGLGFTHVLLSPLGAPGTGGDVFFPADTDRPHPGLRSESDLTTVIATLAEAAAGRGLTLLLDLAPQQFALEHAWVRDEPDCFSVRRQVAEGPVDPRAPGQARGTARSRLENGCRERLLAYWQPRLQAWLHAGMGGFRALRPGAASAAYWKALIATARVLRDDTLFIADITGQPRSDALALGECGFDYLLSSLPWWDFHAPWLVEEHTALRTIAPVMTMPEAPFGTRLRERLDDARMLVPAYERALTAAAVLGEGLLVPAGFEHMARRPMDAALSTPQDSVLAEQEAPVDFAASLWRINTLLERCDVLAQPAHLRALTGPSAPLTGILRTAADPRYCEQALLALFNPDLLAHRDIPAARLRPQMGGEFGVFTPLDADGPVVGHGGEHSVGLDGGQCFVGTAQRLPAVKCGTLQSKRLAKEAARAPRLVVDGVTPSVDGGRYPVKCVVGDALTVEADAFMDGHEVIGVELQWRPIDEPDWQRLRMDPLGNDRFQARFEPERMGAHEYRIEAWFDRYATYARDLRKKHEAKVDIDLDLTEGRLMIEAVRERAAGPGRAHLDRVLEALASATADEQVARLLDPLTLEVVDEADVRAFAAQSPVFALEAERTQARFASWYELFPRSQTDDPKRHGTLRDVIAQLPRVRDMGFDVLYFTPIHPIGRKNRKGRNNTLTPAPDDPGSPYAIGSEAGGHDALHPELGTLEDFRALVRAAADHGLEIALDFAIQCSPDHPWLKDHPGWFDYRPDGSIKYAENPPKKYQDIVNVDFYKDESIPGLWLALRDVILFWIGEGVKTFRVDNPHTKPLPFWQWMIADVRARHPDTIFLSEAFTRPKMMYQLAKVGFSQSYTYFTWRNTKAELQDYLTELATTAPRDFYRPHFFVNTPDINPYYLQSCGRAGFLVRAALAATLSGLWGVYSGFELLESEPIPGKEEYKDSEKYEIRIRDWGAPGNIVPDIRLLNRIRKANPALHTHTNVRFYNAWNDNLIYYGKPSRGGDEIVLVAVNLNPHGAEEAAMEVPLWEFGLPDDGAVDVEDLIRDQAFVWYGKTQHLRLDPADYPFAIWRIRPHRRA